MHNCGQKPVCQLAMPQEPVYNSYAEQAVQAAPEELALEWGRRTVQVSVLRSVRKSLVVEVKPDSTVWAKAPWGLDLADLEEALQNRMPWIIKQLNYFDSFNPRTRPLQYVSGGSVKYLGRHYRFKIKVVEAGQQASVQVVPGYIMLSSSSAEPEALAAMFNDFLVRKSQDVFAAVLKEVLPLFSDHSLPAIKLKVRSMPRRWGSCTRRGVISLHPSLLKAPRACIKYVLVHELCHLVIWNHTKAFYELQRALLPEAERLKSRLETWMG